MACRWTKVREEVKSSYCPLCLKRTVYTEPLIGITRLMISNRELCCCEAHANQHEQHIDRLRGNPDFYESTL